MLTATVPLDTGTGVAGRTRNAPSATDLAVRLDAALDEGLEQPCRIHDPDLWFAESPADLERAKQLCGDCPVRAECLAAALAQRESCGVWGGEIFQDGVVLARKRPRGRPRKNRAGP